MSRRRFVREIDLDVGRITKETYFRGRLPHRDPNEGPAVVYRDREWGYVRLLEYRFNGCLHREKGPAVVYPSVDDQPDYEEYYRFGQLHRDPREGPARIKRTRAKVISVEDYYWKGQRHRDRNDGPASITRHYRTGVILEEEYWENGKRVPAPQNPLPGPRPYPGDPETDPMRYSRDPVYYDPLPSSRWLVEEMDLEAGRLTRAIYRHRVEHGPLAGDYVARLVDRDPADGPALLERDWETGIATLTEYRVESQLHRERGPAKIVRDRLSRHAILEGYYRSGRPHRNPSEGPAVIERNPETGTIMREEFWLKGKQIPAPARPPDGRTDRKVRKPAPR